MGEEQTNKEAYEEAKILLVQFTALRQTYLNDYESLQIALAKNKTDLRELDRDIALTQAMVRALGEQID